METISDTDRLCECGCGQPAPLATYTNRPMGYIEGQPVRFIHGHNRRVRDIPAAFWSKVDRSGGPDACWLWMGALSHGYGVMRVDGQNHPAHRLALELTDGPIPPEKDVCHNCPGGDNPRCVNPAHLFVGTHAENMRDAGEKGQVPREERHHWHKLTAAEATEIRTIYQAGGISQRKLAERYGISYATVADIAHRHSWRHLP